MLARVFGHTHALSWDLESIPGSGYDFYSKQLFVVNGTASLKNLIADPHLGASASRELEKLALPS